MKSNAILLFSLFLIVCQSLSAQIYNPQMNGGYPPYNNGNYQNQMANSTAFRQEIARVEIKVVRGSRPPLPITQVPRLEKGDVLKVRLLDEAVNGMKPDQTNFEWTFLAAFLNPIRNNADETVSNEIQFKKTGWYSEYSFTVPYDSQPMFFLYTKPNYRTKILDMIKKNQDDLRKIGEKTIEIADAYAKIGSFLNEVQMVLQQNRYRNPYGNGTYGGYGNYQTYPNYGYPNNNLNTTNRPNQQSWYDNPAFKEQLIERLAKGFNIELPSCWGNRNGFGNYGGYQNYGGYNNYGGYQNYGGYNNYGMMNDDFMNRVQCVAQNIRIEDFDMSISRMLQQGGVLVASQLAQKYPQLAYWLNLAGVAIDLILKISRRTPLRLVPTIISNNPNQGQNNQGQYNAYQQQNVYQNNLAVQNPKPISSIDMDSTSAKLSIYAESSPRDNNFVTAYPLVTHKWQANPDPEIINLPVPTLLEGCLHTGQNILRNTDLMGNWMADGFTRDFKLLVTAPNGFRREFSLKKNQGMSGWELNLTKEDLNSFPKIKMALDAEISGQRGFNEIRSAKFEIPVSINDGWEISPDSVQKFTVGERRSIALKNRLGSCGCLQAVVYKPSFGGQFVFEGKDLIFSEDGKEVSFEVDAREFKAGEGKLEIRQFGGEISTLNLTLFPEPPKIEDVRLSKGDNRAIVTGTKLEQIRAIKISGKRAIPEAKSSSTERAFIFEDAAARQETNIFSVEIELENNRVLQSRKTFTVSPARPTIATKKANEVEGTAITKPTAEKKKIGQNLQVELSDALIFPANATEISVSVQNALTDYDFRLENITIETTIEKGSLAPNQLPETNFEVLDWKNIRINFVLTEQLQKLLSGRRLQFRIVDKERGKSDWFTINKTFARLPNISSIKCLGANCEIRGTGLEYISQVSTDGGQVWYPNLPETLSVQVTADGNNFSKVPLPATRNPMRIRLRDYFIKEGLVVRRFGQ